MQSIQAGDRQQAHALSAVLTLLARWLAEPPAPGTPRACATCHTVYDQEARAQCPHCGDYNTPF